ncbi:MAG TPA: hypothetical protein VMJ35_14570 [Dongiaceae bacterium]|nr:hypothetical protein [Dongiaceae bacterium]
MKRFWLVLTLSFCLLPTVVCADTVILRDGASYSGQCVSPSNELEFTDSQGIQYKFPVGDVQSVVFTSTADIVSLRSGKMYSGQYNGPESISFRDAQGIEYQFPLRDVETLLFAKSATPPAASPIPAKVIPLGSEITVQTDENIDSNDSSSGQLFAASVREDVFDSAGAVAIPRGSRAKLVVRNITGGGATGSPQLVLDLFSVDVNGKEYRVDSADVDLSSKRGVGKNKRTLEYGAGGAGFGALLGAVFGGGRGAGIGAAAGAGAGLLTQIFTRGSHVKVPAETTMRFRLDRTLVLKPKP